MEGRHERQDWRTVVIRRWRAWQRHAAGVYYAVSCLCLLTALLAVVTAVVRPCVVQGRSMVPTLQNGDYLLLSCLNYEPEVGDIVAVSRENNTPLIKRVIALAGDTLRIDSATGTVFRNGVALEESYIAGTTAAVQLLGEVTVPHGMLFVMGDNRGESHDSRYQDIGFVSVEAVIGKAQYRLYPLSRGGKL